MTLLRPLERPATAFATLLTALGVGVVGAWLGIAASGVAVVAPRVGLVMVGFAASASAVVLGASRFTVGPAPRAFDHVRVGIVSALFLTWDAIDTIYFRLFSRHLDQSAVQLGWEAVRSRTLRVGPADVAALLGEMFVVALFVTFVHAGLSRVPCGERLTFWLRGVGRLVIVLGLLGAFLRDKFWDERHDDAARLARALPWSSNAGAVPGDDSRARVDWGTDMDARTSAELGAVRAKLAAASLDAREKPNLLIVHVESLRFDAFTSQLMPRLTQLSSECWTAKHHYSTGNNTGSSVFGLVTGLGGYFYVGARANPAPALPLLALHRLGYRNFVHFANNLADYDGIYDVVFRGAVDESFTAKEASSDRMDVEVVEHYLGSLDSAPGPRFDYLVLDSTHYDYAYPPEYERHTPSGTLGLGVRDAVIFEAGINDRMRPRAPLVKNRYLNSVEWVDSLIGRLVDGLHRQGRWTNTWVAIVGDHGEAFWEHGTFGHGMGLEDEQIRVPLVLCGAHLPSARYEYTSHADIMPTWFAQMGVTGAPGPFMSGHSLAVYRPETDVAVAGMGITGRFMSRRFVAAGRNLKVTFDNTADWPIASVRDEADRLLPGVPGKAYAVLAEALGTKLLCSPSD